MTPDQYRAYLLLKGLADNTIRTYSSFYTRWWGHPGPDPWHDHHMWTPAGVRGWSASLPQSRSSLEQARTVVTRACEAQGIGTLSGAIPIPRAARKKQSRALTTAESSRLHAVAVDAGLPGLAALVGMYTAARRSEIACLSWRRVDFAARELTLRRPKNRDTHTVPMHPTLARHLGLYRVDGQRWVFPGKWGGHVSPDTVWRWIKRLADAAGIARLYPHRLRHTCLTEIVDATGDLRAAQEIAGHADPAVTARYTRASEERKRAAIRVLDVYGDAA